MIARTLNVEFLNRVANDPAVRPHVGALGHGEIDLTPVVGNPANIALANEHGGFLFVQHEPGVYEVHTLFLPEGRGAAVVQAMREARQWMFSRTNAVALQTKVSAPNEGAALLAKWAGFQQLFSRTVDGERVEFMALPIERWAALDDELEAGGVWFHQQLEAAKSAHGSVLDRHDDDPAHDRAVGATLLMVRAGQPAKAVAFYNRWARLAGYAPVVLISDAPPTIDVMDAVVELRGEELGVLLCR